ncbi:hypothetical protein CANCADRAFT_23711 [Tortispora caseinolytica NRRL Y-17796]|uniref:Major facilitator superfamily (MFS) profile domain-containing protein n=1 Tax=Tortispora caseinolytica NRRL Y-17796 TaxID=767744 RepID=A0A1E4TJJ9_9ASCO|nr:hypothetical protein CANCADRAFT_23711 [Tortispora caseinolytica NRRL Y-17796]
MIFRRSKKNQESSVEAPVSVESSQEINLNEPVKDTRVRKHIWSIIGSGAGLFSDGYVNNIIGSVNTILNILYPKEYAESSAVSNVSSIAFAGTVLGQLVFGYFADKHSRSLCLTISTLILIVFSILAAGSWGAGGSIGGMLAALTAYRFFLGVGIGGEYPAGSVACAEASNEVKKGSRNRWFVWFTNSMIDFGFVVAAFVPLVLLWICGMDHLDVVWRVGLGLGAIPPLSLLYIRLHLKESEQFAKTSMRHVHIPYILVIKYYWFRLIVVSLIWFIYDFGAYSFGLYSSFILSQIVTEDSLYESFGWNVVFNLFYIPGCLIGALFADWWGPKITLAVGVSMQAIIGFIMAGLFATLKDHVGAFVVVYGIFASFGEFGPGDNIGLIASKTSASPIRGHYYGICAAVGKVGAFVGTYVFPVIIKNLGHDDPVKGYQGVFWVASSLCVFSAVICMAFVPRIDQDCIVSEDDAFIEYLESKGWDTSRLGLLRKESGFESAESAESNESLVDQQEQDVDKKQ